MCFYLWNCLPLRPDGDVLDWGRRPVAAASIAAIAVVHNGNAGLGLVPKNTKYKNVANVTFKTRKALWF